MEFTLTQKIIGIFTIIVLTIGLLFFLLFLNHTSINEIGVQYNSGTGEIELQETPGWYVTSPLVRVAYISTLPIRITIPSNARVIVSKVVRFKPQGVEDYIRMQGFEYAMNSSLKNVLMGYAFSGSTYTFLDIMQETTDEVIIDPRPIEIK